MNDAFISKSLFRLLEEKDSQLSARLLEMQRRSLVDWMPLLVPDKGSHAGLLHLINVGRNAEKMIPEAKRGDLSAGELFLLLSAVLLHDIGRILARPQKPLCKNTKCEEKPCVKPDWNHHKKSEEIIQKLGYALGLPDDMTIKYCGLLAYSHGLALPPEKDQHTFPDVNGCSLMELARQEYRNTSIEPIGPIRIPLIAAILRIADETENHWTRALNEQWYRLHESEGFDLWKAFRRRVEDVEFCHVGECILMHLGSAPTEAELSKFAGVSEKIERVLTAWGKELQPLGLQFRDVFFVIQGRIHKIKMVDGSARALDRPMVDVLKQDDQDQDVVRLVRALKRLSNSTLGHPDFPWQSIEAEVGRPLRERDKWLIERMGDWAPGAVTVDRHKHKVQIDNAKLNELKHELVGSEHV